MLIPVAYASGVIEDAPTFSRVLGNVLDFVLQLAGIVGILGVVVAGMLYFFANGDRRRIATAKKITIATIIGFVILLGAWIVIKTISGFFM